MKWNFRRFDEKIDYAAVSDEEYELPVFGDDLKRIYVWLEGMPRHGELRYVTDEIPSWIHTRLRNGKMAHYLEWDLNYYEIFGTTQKRALEGIAGKREFVAMALGETGLLIYSWGKELYLVAPLVREVE